MIKEYKKNKLPKTLLRENLENTLKEMASKFVQDTKKLKIIPSKTNLVLPLPDMIEFHDERLKLSPFLKPAMERMKEKMQNASNMERRTIQADSENQCS
jgi:hypothetical protein